MVRRWDYFDASVSSDVLRLGCATAAIRRMKFASPGGAASL
jgi:hypothetical protein